MHVVQYHRASSFQLSASSVGFERVGETVHGGGGHLTALAADEIVDGGVRGGEDEAKEHGAEEGTNGTDEVALCWDCTMASKCGC